ncbi:hypothetical protein G9A89_005283 [Geosiphon pyriformis]|nr:hypothetical protein G9A89_005283 [Geosiphon pyriformis]
MVTVAVYIVSFSIFACSFVVSVISLLIPRWLYFETPRPNKTVTSYGLFKKCSTLVGGCRNFPLEDYGDCNEEGFCDNWSAAIYDLILAAFISTIALLYLFFFVLMPDSSHRTNAWMWATGMFALSAALQTNAIYTIDYLKNNSGMFAYESYDVAFALASSSTILNWVNAAMLGGTGLWLWWKNRRYQRIE